MGKRRAKKISVNRGAAPVEKTGQRGGPRAMAGRPAGSSAKRTIAVREVTMKIIRQGKLPLRVMVNNMNHYAEEALDLEVRLTDALADNSKKFSAEQFLKALELLGQATDCRMKSQKCASDCAPYLHPRLSSISINPGSGDHPRDLPRDASIDQVRDEFRRLRQASFSPEMPLATDENGDTVEAEILEPEAEREEEDAL